jgi:hypothetical protein
MQVEQVNTVKNNAAALYQKTLEEHKHKLATEQEEDGKEKLMGNVVDKVKSFVKLPKTFGTTPTPEPSVTRSAVTIDPMPFLRLRLCRLNSTEGAGTGV